jgi:hypothetical protein
MFGELQRWLRPHGSRLALCRLRTEMQDLMKSFPSTSNIPLYNDKPVALSANW